MQLRGIDFGYVLNASGARGWYGEGYWYQRWLRPVGLDWRGSTFVGKTTTLAPRAGNMPLDVYSRPLELKPKCIIVKPWKGVVLNAVGLSGPGAAQVVSEWFWRDRLTMGAQLPTGPKMMSFMPVGPTMEDRIQETQGFVEIFLSQFGPGHSLRGQLAVQLNLSCPNVGLDPQALLRESQALLDHMGDLGVPVLVKVNATFPVYMVAKIAEHSSCDAIICSNTIPWGKLPERIDWKGVFGSSVSPLAHLGGGGLSGAPLLPIVCDWIQEARHVGIGKPIVGGGGILSTGDVKRMFSAGASAVEIGSVAILRPWRVRSLIRKAGGRC